MKRILVFISCFYLLTSIVNAQIVPDANGVVYVTPSGIGNGISWGASANLDDALVAAVKNTTITQIWIKGGSYKPKYDNTGAVPATSSNRTYFIRSGLKVFGSLIGTETAISNNGNYTIAATDTTYFDGSMATLSDYSGTLVSIRNAGEGTLLNGVVIINGRNGFGSGLQNDGSNGGNSIVSVNNCIFRSNQSGSGGGGGALNNGNLGYAKITFSNCSFVGNSTLGSGNGGAMENLGNNLGQAYAIFNNCSFVSNKTTRKGGALTNAGTSSGLADIRFTNCQFKYNQSTGDQAGVLLNTGNVNATFTGCLFYANRGNLGVNIALNDCSTGSVAKLSIINCTIYERTSSSVTEMFNHTNGGGGGTAITNIFNSLLWKGNGYVFSAASVYTPQAAIGYTSTFNFMNNVVQGITPSASFYNSTLYNFYPKFLDTANADLRLQMCSPASEAGMNSLYSGALATDSDLAGGLRLVNANIDLGAYEAPYLEPLITKEPQNIAVCSNSDTSFSVKASGDNLGYQWQVMKSTSGSFTSISGAVHDTLRIITDTTMNGWQFRCIISNCLGADTSNNVTLTYTSQALHIIKQPVNALTCYRTDTSFSVGVTGGAFLCQWQVKTLSGSFTDILNATHDTLSIVSADSSMNGWQYRAIIRNCLSTDTSDVVTLTVRIGPIVAPLSNIAICSGDTLHLNVQSFSGADVVYNWTGPNGFTASVKDTFIIHANSTKSGLYWLETKNGFCDRIDSAQIIVDTPLVLSVIAMTPLCAGNVLRFDVNDTMTENSYSWTGPMGFTSTLKAPVIPSVLPGNAGTYIVTVKGKNSCKNSAAKSIVVSPIPPLGTVERY